MGNGHRERLYSTECQAFYPVVRLGPPAPSPARECCSPSFGSKGSITRLLGREEGGPNSDDGTDTFGTLGILSIIPLRVMEYKFQKQNPEILIKVRKR
jgi:hypothetical protein